MEDAVGVGARLALPRRLDMRHRVGILARRGAEVYHDHGEGDKGNFS